MAETVFFSVSAVPILALQKQAIFVSKENTALDSNASG